MPGRQCLSRIAGALLVRVAFGARPGSAAGDELLLAYRELGPHGVVWQALASAPGAQWRP